jgi:deazaflavin-dependent oxidoreductase (nitroreductase family)
MEFPAPPRGLKAIPWRMPIWIYRLGLGGLLGKRFLLLTHVGKKTGLERQTVLEIVQCNPAQGEYYVVSGFGVRSHWYQNIKSNPAVKIQVGYQFFQADAFQLNPQAAGQIILEYAEKHPQALKGLSKMIGYKIEHTREGYLAFGRQIPVIRFSAHESSRSKVN